MDTLRVIKTEAEYRKALDTFEALLDAPKGGGDRDEREVLAVLIEQYENEHHSIDPPDPIEAIKFRMEQAGLTRKDLEPCLGGKAKVSEVLNGKRDLTLAAIRALHANLGIPAEVLIQKPLEPLPESFKDLDFRRFPLREMESNGAFRGFTGGRIADRAEEAIRWLVERAGGFNALRSVGFRTGEGMRVNSRLDAYALLGWCMHVLSVPRPPGEAAVFSPKSLSKDFLRALVSLSVLDDGPRKARDFLSKAGITLVAVPHLRHTYLDGAAFLTPGGRPVIALTLRYDRVDNFWFVLLHELSHLALGHLTGTRLWIADDLDVPGGDSSIEKAADELAAKTLLPSGFDLHLRETVSLSDIVEYARQRAVNPAIVAGRVQHERKDFRSFARLLARGQVRRQFFNT